MQYVDKEPEMIKRKKKEKDITTSLVIASCGIIKEKTKGMTRGKTMKILGKLMEDREVGELISELNLSEGMSSYRIYK